MAERKSMSYTAMVLNEDLTDYNMITFGQNGSLDSAEYLVFHLADLCSKYGFGDGGQVNEWRRNRQEEPIRLTNEDELLVLEALARTYLKPALTMLGFEVIIGVFELSIHNMIRVIEIDGVPFNDYSANKTPFDGIDIAISTQKVDEVIERLYKK